MLAELLRADCERCAALCCLSLAFDRSEQFAFDKAAGVPCPELDARHRCTIHSIRERRGCAGCASYDCLGAGQRVTEDVFGGRSWRDDPALIAPMMEAFWVLRQVHEAWLLVDLAGRLPLTPELAERRRELLRALEGERGATDTGARAVLVAFERDGLSRRVQEFVAELRGLFVQTAGARRRLPRFAAAVERA